MWLRSSKFWLLSLALLVVFTQAALAYHEADLSQHAPNDVCEWCVGGVPFHGSLPAPSGFAVAANTHALSGAVHPVLLLGFTSRAYYSRAPPSSSV